MSKRPSFQFYPADWISNSNLKRCSFEEKGVWLEVICLLHDSNEYGILRWTLEEITQAVRCDISLLKSLARKNILKGTDNENEKVSFSDTFAQRQGPPLSVTLIENQSGPIWYSSRMVRDEHIRKKRAAGGALALEHPSVPKKREEITVDKDTNKDTYKDTFSGTFDCTTSSSSSSSSNNNKKQQRKKAVTHVDNFSEIEKPKKKLSKK